MCTILNVVCISLPGLFSSCSRLSIFSTYTGVFHLNLNSRMTARKQRTYHFIRVCLGLYVATLYYLFHAFTSWHDSLARIKQANKFSFVVGILLRLGFEREKVVPVPALCFTLAKSSLHSSHANSNENCREWRRSVKNPIFAKDANISMYLCNVLSLVSMHLYRPSFPISH